MQRQVDMMRILMQILIFGTSWTIIFSNHSETICLECVCRNTEPYEIDCTGKNMKKIFADEYWPDASEKINELKVDFTDNQITEISAFQTLPIVFLSLRNNHVFLIADKAFKNLNKLIYLDLSGNRLNYDSLHQTVFEGTFSKEFYEPLILRTLNLSHNNIHNIDKVLFDHLPYLEILTMNYNPLKVLTVHTLNAITTLRNLKTLHLAYTELETLPPGFLHALGKLEVLDITGNKFLDVPSDLKFAPTLKSLILDNNPIVEITDLAFENLPNLEGLSINSMPDLESVKPLTFSTLKNLKQLELAYNPKLSELSVNAFKGIFNNSDTFMLKQLYLQNNALKTLDEDMLPWTHIDLIDIQGNPWLCDCHMGWVANKLMNQINHRSPDLTYGVTCADPQKLRRKPLMELALDLDSFRCKGLISIMETSVEVNGIQTYTISPFGIMIMLAALVLLVAGLVGLTILYLRRKTIKEAYMAKQQVKYVRAKDEDNITTDIDGDQPYSYVGA